MSRHRCLAALLVLPFLAVAPPAPEVDEIALILGDPEAKKGLVPDKGWLAAPGERATTVEITPAAALLVDLDNYVKSDGAHDQTGKAKLLESKRVVPLAKGTGVLVLRTFRPPPAVIVQGDPIGNNTRLQQAILDDLSRKHPLEVRVLDGPQKDAALFVEENLVAKMVPYKEPATFILVTHEDRFPTHTQYPFVRPGPARRGAAPPDVKTRAPHMLSEGRLAEKRRDIPRAVNFYYFLVVDFPTSSQAKEAAHRLRGLGWERKADGTCEVDPARGFKAK